MSRNALTYQTKHRYTKHTHSKSGVILYYPSTKPIHRQLNYFGFKKLTKSHANVCTYLREHFHRHSPRALILIKRKTNGARQRQLSLDHLEPGYDHSPRALLESEYFYSGSSSTPETSTSSSASISNHMSHPPALQLPPTRFHPHAQHHHHHHPFVNPANTANPNVSAFGNYRNFMHQHQHPLPPHPTHTQNPPYWDNTQYWVLSTESPANPGIDQILYEGEEDSGSAQKFECAHPLMSTKGSSDEMSASDLVALRDAVALICDDDELLGSSPESSENHHQPVEMDKENIKVEQKPRSKNKSPVSAKEEEKSTSVYATV